MQSFGKVGDLVMNFSASTCAAANALMLFDQQRKVVGSDVNPEGLSAAEAHLALTPVSEMLNQKLDISRSDKVEESVEVFTDEIVHFWLRKNAT